jgi:hypothetical protein
MESAPTAIADDADLKSALEWFIEIDGAHSSLPKRIRIAQEFFRAHAACFDSRWPDPSDLLVKSDLIASYLAQADAFLNRPDSYDLTLAAHILPFLKHIGAGLEFLRRMPGAINRGRKLLNPRQEHPDGALYELATAIRYAYEEFEVEFVAETSQRSADLRVGPPDSTKDLYIECKRLRASDYEIREKASVRALFAPLATLIRESRLSVFIDVQFTSELAEIPHSYLAERIASAVRSPLYLPDGYPWRDEYSQGVVREAHIDSVRADTREHGPLIVGPKMWRLLTGEFLPSGPYHFMLRGLSDERDLRYVDKVYYASVLSWRCLTPASVSARARHVTSLLANIDRQLATAPMGIAHIGMYAEYDTVAADRRRERNLEAVARFRANSKLIDIYTHYYMPRVSESHSWTIDETADTNSRMDEPLLADPRILVLGDLQLDTTEAAWHLPSPPLRG